MATTAPNLRRTMSVEEAAEALGVGRTTAYTQIREGRFPAPVIRIGKRVVVPVAAIERLLAEGTRPAPQGRD
jgi:excisionase family DNA binding protein